jgi:BBSome-interacting protein 1
LFNFKIITYFFQESAPQLVLCKPKLLPLKSFTLQKLEAMQKDATEKAKEQMNEAIRQEEVEAAAEPTHAPETISFD